MGAGEEAAWWCIFVAGIVVIILFLICIMRWIIQCQKELRRETKAMKEAVLRKVNRVEGKLNRTRRNNNNRQTDPDPEDPTQAREEEIPLIRT